MELDQKLQTYCQDKVMTIDAVSLKLTPENLLLTAKHIPEEFFCHLSGNLFSDPMLLPSGHAIEGEQLREWMKQKAVDPFSMAPIKPEDVKTHNALKEKLGRFQNAYPSLKELVETSRYRPGQQVRVPPSQNRWAGDMGFSAFSGINNAVVTQMLAFDYALSSRRLELESVHLRVFREQLSLAIIAAAIMISMTPLLTSMRARDAT